jgi:hypothetical protein
MSRVARRVGMSDASVVCVTFMERAGTPFSDRDGHPFVPTALSFERGAALTATDIVPVASTAEKTSKILFLRLLVRAIAERLLLGFTTGVPIIRFPRRDIDGIRRFLRKLA